MFSHPPGAHAITSAGEIIGSNRYQIDASCVSCAPRGLLPFMYTNQNGGWHRLRKFLGSFLCRELRRKAPLSDTLFFPGCVNTRTPWPGSSRNLLPSQQKIRLAEIIVPAWISWRTACAKQGSPVNAWARASRQAIPIAHPNLFWPLTAQGHELSISTATTTSFPRNPRNSLNPRAKVTSFLAAAPAT